MKGFNIKSRWSGFLAKGIKALLLLLVLQADCCGLKWGQGGIAAHTVNKMSDEQFKDTVGNIEDVSYWMDDKKRLMFYAAAKYGKHIKLQEILKKYIQKVKDFGYKHKNEEFINTPDLTTKKTAIEEAIREGHIDVVKVFIKFAGDAYKNFIHIDINKVGKGGTTSLVALQNKQAKIAKILLEQPDIDIKTIDSTSGDTALHLAIKNKDKYKDIAKKLITRFKEEAPDLLFAQNKDGDAPLHLTMQYKLRDQQSNMQPDKESVSFILINAIPKEKLWIKNNQGKTALVLGIEHEHKDTALLIHEMSSLNEIFKLLDKIANPAKAAFFIAALYRIGQLKNADSSNVVQKVNNFLKEIVTSKKPIYVSNMGSEPTSNKEIRIAMFACAIKFLNNNLGKEELKPILETILNDINKREVTRRVQGGISKKYADKLRNIVNSKGSSTPSQDTIKSIESPAIPIAMPA
ncbi:MAG: ankyrin repeat domain-containing protein [Candidatus Cardinium sp.]|uniref:ankyrin repeat domain-containing protein n=1 Tax=Cardinium endosymbiont of Dermatophagoides farinae TaxID=2597823 RepID=UPI001183D98D|nr:ankyrin repeat domain-containing protein [Cardinium endosymbiont of Dermatophagoides farinae]TSJ80556.1 ankyrin repeat domain-containing protein [Cardinium endosymbiont of Dermatophagoides farinae]UWW96534.1 MAG: ankyrin repeat domain-containing protein [Candidatus Cardinium sp.]